MDKNEKDIFQYTYSAKEQEEIKAIRQKYAAPPEEDKMTQLRRLDAGVTQKATTVALIFGIVGALILGMGMSLIMTDLHKVLPLEEAITILVGFILGIVGILMVCVAYPLYNAIVKKERARIAPEILRLSDELLQ